jgi:hypothetical protein
LKQRHRMLRLNLKLLGLEGLRLRLLERSLDLLREMLRINKLLLLIPDISLKLLVKQLLVVGNMVFHDASLEHLERLRRNLLQILFINVRVVLLKREILLEISFLGGHFH